MKRTREQGMTLIEIMVVVVIMGALMGIVVPSVIRHVAKARVGTAKAQMSNIGEAVTNYRLERHRLPPTLAVLTEEDPLLGEPYIRHIPKDPWGAPYEYLILSRKKYEIHCLGIDGEPDTNDDLRHPVFVDD